MTQWLLENKLVALNTMYKKQPQKQVTYHTPKNVEKQLDYILMDKKHHSWSRDAEANDILHMGSDHRCVMAKFEIPKEKNKRTPRQSKAPATEQRSETCEEGKQLKYLDLEQEVEEAESKTNTKSAAGEVTDTSAEAVRQDAEAGEAEGKTATDASAAQAAAADDESTEKRDAAATEGTAASEEGKTATDASAAQAAAAVDESIEQRHAAAPEGTAASEAQEMNEKDERIRALIQKRKTTAKHEKDRIRGISKEIKNASQKTKGRKDRKKFRRFWKKSRVQRTYPVSSQ